MTVIDETVHILIGWNDETESPWVSEAQPGDAEGSDSCVEADVPASLWRALCEIDRKSNELHHRVATAAGYDDNNARMQQCCPVWRGHVSSGHQWFEVCIPASGNENEWPAGGREVDVAHRDNRADAEAFIAGLPEQFQLLPSGSHQLITVDRSTLFIEERGYNGHTTSCYTCGWTRDEHADKGSQDDDA